MKRIGESSRFFPHQNCFLSQLRKRHPLLRIGYGIRYIRIKPFCRFRIRYPGWIHAASAQKIDTVRVEYYRSYFFKMFFVHDPPIDLI
jgi:hypothetical protein